MSSALHPQPSNLSSSRPDVFSPDWTVVGPGGGGGGIAPVISPHNKDVFYSATDMQPMYRSDDAGATWRMFDSYRIRGLSCPITFHPTDPSVLYVGILGGLMKSVDGGFQWHKVFGNVWREIVDIGRAVLLDPRNPDVVYAAFDHMGQRSHSFFARSDDAGATWTIISRTPSVLAVNHLYMDPSTGWIFAVAICRDFSFTAMDTGFPPKILLSRDGCLTWEEVRLPKGWLLDGAMVLRKGKPRLFALMRAEIKRKKVIGGLFRSDNLGKTWKPLNSAFDLAVGWNVRWRRPAPAMEFRKFAVAPSNPDVLYVPLARHGKEPEWMSMVYKSTDGGDTWSRVLNSDPQYGPVNVEPDWITECMGWWWGGNPNSLCISPTDPDRMLFCDDGRIMGTLDGGKSWRSMYSTLHPGGAAQTNGWETTNCYSYNVDPHDPRVHFIAYTDIGLFKSLDSGKTWKYSVKTADASATWRANFYHVVFDPSVKGLIWGAATGVHDLPHWKMLQGHPSRWDGTVVVSRDGGDSWNPIPESGLPPAPCTYLILDKSSPVNARVLYASMFGKGVFKSSDGGRTWAAKNEGLGFLGNLNVWQTHFAADGSLLAAVSAARAGERVIPGGLFRSRDGGDSWEFVNYSRPLQHLFGIAAHPTDPDTFYCAGCDLPIWYAQGLRNRTDDHLPLQSVLAGDDGALGGGLYKTTDGGRTFRRTLGVWNCYSPSIDPRNPNVVYAACFDTGVFRSTDAGETWKRLEGLPMVHVNHISFDPTDPQRIYALTCGAGVWTARIED